jgi:hypothetical protein
LSASFSQLSRGRGLPAVSFLVNLGVSIMKTVSIGFNREDGDFAILATLNNNDGHLSDDAFHNIVQGITLYMGKQLGHKVDVL